MRTLSRAYKDCTPSSPAVNTYFPLIRGIAKKFNNVKSTVFFCDMMLTSRQEAHVKGSTVAQYSLILKRLDDLKKALWGAAHPVPRYSDGSPSALEYVLQETLAKFAQDALDVLHEETEVIRAKILGTEHRLKKGTHD